MNLPKHDITNKIAALILFESTGETIREVLMELEEILDKADEIGRQYQELYYKYVLPGEEYEGNELPGCVEADTWRGPLLGVDHV